MAKIYWLIGQPGTGKTVLGKKLVEFLSTEKKNWRSKVFHIDGDDLRELTTNKDYSTVGRIRNIRNAQMIAEYIYKTGCDVVVSLVSPYRDIREDFKNKIGEDIEEFYVHTSKQSIRFEYKVDDFEAPISNFFDVDTTTDTPIQSFTKIVHYLRGK
jgi:adenylylsulfate kinase-like enzyme